MNNLLDQINQLDFAERMQLVEDLWDSLADRAQTLPLTDAQRAELDRRLDVHAKDPGRGQPLDAIASKLGVRL